MPKNILAISEGGPDAVPSFRLAVRAAALFDGTVDAIHFAEGRRHELDITSQSMPFMGKIADDRLAERERESRRAWKEISQLAGGSLTDVEGVSLAQLVKLGRFADLLVIGRPGTDPDNIAPETVKAALYECARPVLIAPPRLEKQTLASVVVAWNGSQQAARAVDYAMPFLEKAAKVTVVAAGDSAGLLTWFARHGVKAEVIASDHHDLSGRARGRALIDIARTQGAELLVMGAYGHGGLSNFLGLGGATAKVISSCPVPLLLAH
jgi:nucleotide-binding universal stress UspA family protein